MDNFFTKKTTLILFGVVVILLISFVFFLERKTEVLTSDVVTQLSSAEEVVYWKQQILKRGGPAAYADFVAMYLEQPYQIQHTHAHVFGEALYKVVGIEGVSVCDSNFGFGCFHSFFGWAMVANGTGIVKELDVACIEAYGEKGLGCPHGIGHGVMVEIGTEHLDDALAICSELNWQKPIGGCSSGVFMEYNQNTMGDGSLRAPKDDWHFPCNAVSDRYTEACYFEQTTWWAGIMNDDFNFIGKRCAEIEVLADKQACFRGAGHTSNSVFSFNFVKMREACSKMPDAEAELLCVEGATWLTSWDSRFQDTWEQMCAGYADEELIRCLNSKNFI